SPWGFTRGPQVNHNGTSQPTSSPVYRRTPQNERPAQPQTVTRFGGFRGVPTQVHSNTTPSEVRSPNFRVPQTRPETRTPVTQGPQIHQNQPSVSSHINNNRLPGGNYGLRHPSVRRF
ncbi:MAG: hypothetical protein Q4G59_12010, partial [Planctomycetia bacterium]|nr:hypothetical protein [Planctomycetia bacterium]